MAPSSPCINSGNRKELFYPQNGELKNCPLARKLPWEKRGMGPKLGPKAASLVVVVEFPPVSSQSFHLRHDHKVV